MLDNSTLQITNCVFANLSTKYLGYSHLGYIYLRDSTVSAFGCIFENIFGLLFILCIYKRVY
jgi:hypothetical protein